MAYISRVKSNNNVYIYLTEYSRQTYSSKSERHIFSFGKSNIALYKMQKWLRNFELFPQELKERGFTKVDLENWIDSLKTKSNQEKKRAVF